MKQIIITIILTCISIDGNTRYFTNFNLQIVFTGNIEVLKYKLKS